MSYGHLHPAQVAAVRPIVRGRKVYDLGAGDMGLSEALAIMGAREVIAIDSKLPESSCLDVRVRSVHATFDSWGLANPRFPLDVAFLSWPANRIDVGLQVLVERAVTVIYLGKCTGGTMCGSKQLFQSFLQRELLVYIPHLENTLCIYGRRLGSPRKGEHEERAGLDWENIWPYEEERPRVDAASGKA